MFDSTRKRLVQLIGKTKKPLMIDTGALDTKMTDNIYQWHKNSGGKGFLVLHDFHTNNIAETILNLFHLLKKDTNARLALLRRKKTNLIFFQLGWELIF